MQETVGQEKLLKRSNPNSKLTDPVKVPVEAVVKRQRTRGSTVEAS